MLGESFNEMIGQIQDLTVSLQEVEIKQKTEELRRKEAEIDAFQMQINSHLIYNTLDII
jgi:two-component system sensor histidine kinase YesM